MGAMMGKCRLLPGARTAMWSSVATMNLPDAILSGATWHMPLLCEDVENDKPQDQFVINSLCAGQLSRRPSNSTVDSKSTLRPLVDYL
jgi:hypothetical protein